MDSKLKKALDLANFSVTYENQKRLVKEKFETDCIYYYNGGQFTVDRELVLYTDILAKDFDRKGRDYNPVVLDDNETPIHIESVIKFHRAIIEQYQTALANYKKALDDLNRNRSKILKDINT